MTTNDKVQKLKSSFTVEGTLLFMSDRFTKEEVAEMRKQSTAHSSHWLGLTRVWKDEEIAEQIETFEKMTIVSEMEIKKAAERIMKTLLYQDMVEEKKMFEKSLTVFVWGDLKPLNPDLWRKFGSAPFFITDSNKKLVELEKKYGACGMQDIFGEKFSEGYHMINAVASLLSHFDNDWKETKAIRELKEKKFSSGFQSLEDIEENVVVKKIGEEAQKFYMDKTKKFEERVKVFAKHGASQSWIFEPADRDLKTIFELYNENDVDRHSNIETPDILEWWVGYLKSYRCKIDWSNRFHPKVKQKGRNYHPSQEAIDKLYRYYMEKLFLEGIGSFEFDW